MTATTPCAASSRCEHQERLIARTQLLRGLAPFWAHFMLNKLTFFNQSRQADNHSQHKVMPDVLPKRSCYIPVLEGRLASRKQNCSVPPNITHPRNRLVKTVARWAMNECLLTCSFIQVVRIMYSKTSSGKGHFSPTPFPVRCQSQLHQLGISVFWCVRRPTIT